MLMTLLKLCHDLLKHNTLIKDICWYVNRFDRNTVTSDIMKTVYIRNNSRETPTKQISGAREHGKM